MIYRIFILLSLTFAQKNNHKAEFKSIIDNQTYYGSWEYQIENCLELHQNGGFHLNISDFIMNFAILNQFSDICIKGSVQLKHINKDVEFSQLLLYQNNNLIFETQKIQTPMFHDSKNPEDFTLQNILYCSICSFLMMLTITLIIFFIQNYQQLRRDEVSGLATVLSIGQQWWVPGFLGLSFDFSDGYGKSYFIIALSICTIYIGFSFKLLKILNNFFKEKIRFCDDSFFFIINFCIWLGFSIAAIYIISTSQLDEFSSQSHYQFALKSYLFCQLLPLFEQIRSTLQRGINNLSEIQKNQQFYYLYLFFISLPSIYSINFQTYYYAVFLYEADYYLLTIFLVLFTFCIIVIIFQHQYGPIFEQPKTVHFPCLETKRRTQSDNEITPVIGVIKQEDGYTIVAGFVSN